MSIPWGMTSPLRAEVYLTSMKVFPNLKWGTRDPVAFRDSELGLIRLRAFGVFNLRILQPVLFINSLVGTQGVYTTAEIEEYLNRVIVSRFNDYMGEKIDTIFNLPARYNVDFRYSRRVRIGGNRAAEVIAEVKNLFNSIQTSNVNATIATDTLGIPLAALPTNGDQLTPTGGYEQRQLQIGFKFSF